jgi:hypothetical protein
MAISAVLIRRLKESLSSKIGNSLLPSGTSTPFSDLISTATVSERWNVTLLICVWTVPSCLALGGELWPATIPGATAQRITHSAPDVETGRDMCSSETIFLKNCKFAPRVDTNGDSSFKVNERVRFGVRDLAGPFWTMNAQARLQQRFEQRLHRVSAKGRGCAQTRFVRTR